MVNVCCHEGCRPGLRQQRIPGEGPHPNSEPSRSVTKSVLSSYVIRLFGQAPRRIQNKPRWFAIEKTMRRLLVLALMTGFFLERSSSARSSPQDPASGKPNVVLIVSDYMGYGDIGSFGATDIRTPNLDRLARQGGALDNAYAAAPICPPSRVGLLTGRYPQRAGIETNVDARNLSFGLRPEETVIARMLSDAGYATAVFGKWHLGYQSSFMPIAHGFGEFFGHLDWTVD